MAGQTSVRLNSATAFNDPTSLSAKSNAEVKEKAVSSAT